MFRNLILLLLIAGWLTSCNGPDEGKSVNADSLKTDSLLTNNSSDLSDNAMEDIIQNISSPVEMAAFLNETGVPFSKKALHDCKNINQYVSLLGYSTNFGLVDADLCYLNVFRNVEDLKTTVNALKILAGKIGAANYLDDTRIISLAGSSTNSDSLNLVTVTSLNNIDNYLIENKKKNVSVLIAFGEWLECLNQALIAYNAKPVKNIADRIGEQKSALDDLSLVLAGFKGNTDIAKIGGYVDQLKASFEGVKITIEMGQPEQVEKDGMLMIVQNEKSIVEISDKNIKNIKETVFSIRNEIIAYK
jgi:hypothetical protein